MKYRICLFYLPIWPCFMPIPPCFMPFLAVPINEDCSSVARVLLLTLKVGDRYSNPDHSTIFQAEAEAIYQSMQFILSIMNETNINFIKVLSDSQAVITALSSKEIKSKTILKTLKAMETVVASKIKRLNVCWVKSARPIMIHKAMKKQSQLQKMVQQPVPWVNTIKNTVATIYEKEWEDRWINDKRFRKTKQFYSTRNITLAKKVMQWGRINLRKWVQAITGLNNLAEHQVRIDYEIDPRCRFHLLKGVH